MKSCKISVFPMLLLLIAISLVSCEKEPVEVSSNEGYQLRPFVEKMKDPANVALLVEAINKELAAKGKVSGTAAKSAGIVDPFPMWLVSGGLLFRCEDQIVSFDAPYDDNDFYRENPDGTVTIQQNSTKAYASYTNLITGEEYEGYNTRFHAKLTGTYVEVYIPIFDVTIRSIDTSNSPNARVYSGAGKVYSADGDEKTISVHFIDTPTEQKNGCINLN